MATTLLVRSWSILSAQSCISSTLSCQRFAVIDRAGAVTDMVKLHFNQLTLETAAAVDALLVP